MNKLIRPMSGEYVEYLRDESRTVGRADSIAFPHNEAELGAILTAAYTDGERITIQGARTGLAAAAVPEGGCIINLTRMDRVTGMRRDATGRYYLKVQPGVILSQMRKRIEDKRFDTTGWDADSLVAYEDFKKASEQFFTCDPTESSCTIGGMVACNASGARSYLYGPVRQHVSGLRVVLPGGETLTPHRGEVFAAGRTLCLSTDGGRLIDVSLPTFDMPHTKNASGYYIKDDMDAIDLFIGSDGTLGVITEIELSLMDAPGTIWGAACFFEEEDKALDFVIRVRGELTDIGALEYFDARALQILRDAKSEKAAFAGLPTIPAHFAYCIYIEVHCDDDEKAAERLFEVGDLITACGGRETDTWVSRTAFDRDKLIFFRHATPECVNMIIDERKKQDPIITKLGTDMAVPDENLKEIMAMYHAQLAELGLQYAIWGHIGDNHVHVNVLPRSAAEHARTKELYQEWARVISELGGSVSAEHGVGKLKAGFLRVMYGDKHIAEMARLKTVFDPKGLLGVGNMFAPQNTEVKP